MSQPEILILGATGATGHHVLAQAKAEGFKIRLLVRDPSKLSGDTVNLQTTQGDARNPVDVAEAMPPNGLVVSCLGIGPKGPKEFYSQTAKSIVIAAKEKSPRQIIILSTLGTGTTAAKRTPMLSGLFRLLGASWILEDRAREEGTYLECGLPVILLQSSWLSNAKAKGLGRLYDPTDVPRLGFIGPIIPRADVATHLLKAVKTDPPATRIRCLLP